MKKEEFFTHPKSLRIGNYLNASIDDINGVNVLKAISELPDGYRLRFNKDNNDNCEISFDVYPIDDNPRFEPLPIPLTKEWLIKLGFNNEYGKKWSKDLVDLLEDEDGSFFLLVDERTNFTHSYRYVHEIQNLYFVLTGNEIE